MSTEETKKIITLSKKEAGVEDKKIISLKKKGDDSEEGKTESKIISLKKEGSSNSAQINKSSQIIALSTHKASSELCTTVDVAPPKGIVNLQSKPESNTLNPSSEASKQLLRKQRFGLGISSNLSTYDSAAVISF
jgi:hypothetical protein